MAFADSKASILTAGLSTVKVKIAGDAAYYSLPFLTDESTLEVTQISSQPDPKQREYGLAFMVNIKAVTRATDITNMIKMLPEFATYDVFVKADCINGTKFYSAAIDATTGYMGCTVDLINDGDTDRDRRVEFNFMMAVTAAEYQLAITGAAADGTPDAGDAIYEFLSLVVSDITPARIERFDMKETSSGTWDDVIRNLRSGSFRASLRGDSDSRKRVRPNRFRIDFSVVYMQASSTEVALIDNYATRENDYRIAFPDGYVTLNDNCGVNFRWNVEGSVDQSAIITISGGGIVQPSNFAALFTTGSPS